MICAPGLDSAGISDERGSRIYTDRSGPDLIVFETTTATAPSMELQWLFDSPHSTGACSCWCSCSFNTKHIELDGPAEPIPRSEQIRPIRPIRWFRSPLVGDASRGGLIRIPRRQHMQLKLQLPASPFFSPSSQSSWSALATAKLQNQSPASAPLGTSTTARFRFRETALIPSSSSV